MDLFHLGTAAGRPVLIAHTPRAQQPVAAPGSGLSGHSGAARAREEGSGGHKPPPCRGHGVRCVSVRMCGGR